MRIYLIGLPGCGKSTLGRTLAQQINYKFIDMDLYIEQKAMMFIDEIFQAYGQEYFRELESNVLEELSLLEDVVIATGGGVISRKSNKEKIDGVCIYLSAPLKMIEQRLRGSGVFRPLLETKNLTDLYLERKEKYDYFKDFEVDNSELSLCISTILEKIEEQL